MHILNIMLGKGHGGLEQVAIDYHQAFESRGHIVTSLTPPDSWAKKTFSEFTQSTIDFKNAGQWDPIASFKLTKIIKQLNPDILICIGNRAIRLTLRSSKGNIPIVGVAQNHKNKKFENCDAVFCITNQLVHIMHQKGIPDSRVFHVPNMVAKLGNTDRTELRNPPVIGAFGRFVDKKGFRTYIKALDILKTDGVMFKAILGGDGVLKNKLQEQIRSSGLEDEVTFTGWVKDKSKFFNSIDLYIIPSRHEPFGIVLIEAMCESVPCISTKSEGPIEIITDGIDGLLFSIDDEEELALAMKKVLIQQPSQCKKIGSAGFRTIENKYTMNIVSKILEDSAYQVIQDF